MSLNDTRTNRILIYALCRTFIGSLPKDDSYLFEDGEVYRCIADIYEQNGVGATIDFVKSGRLKNTLYASHKDNMYLYLIEKVDCNNEIKELLDKHNYDEYIIQLYSFLDETIEKYGLRETKFLIKKDEFNDVLLQNVNNFINKKKNK